jgi:type IV pilus assembly protein PilY1
MFKGKLSHLVTAAYLSFAVGNTSMVYADDTEIYLNSASSAGTSNILFSLDTSGSMGTLVDENNNGTIDAGERSRIEVLKEAMLTVLDSLPPLNAGILRYHYYGGPILYPVANVDEFACVIEGNCSALTGTTGIQTVTSVLTNGDDDAEQEGSLTVTLDRVALDIGERPAGSCTTVSESVRINSNTDDAESSVGGDGYTDSSSDLEIPREGSNQQVVGLRFQNVSIPAGATVTDARLVFEIDSTTGSGYNAPIDTIIVGENMSGPRNAFSGGTGGEPEDRLANPTIASINWETGEFPDRNENLTTDNISAILDELVNDPAWPATGGDDVVLLIFENPGAAAGSSGSREVESYDGESGAAALLTFNYQTCSAAGVQEIRTGLHFTNVNIPQGATITGARIDFINTTSEAGAPEFRVQMQDVDDAEAFAVGSPLTSRTFHGSPVAWTAASTPALTSWDPVDSTYATPDLTTLVQDVVNRSGWCGGNDMMFMIERTGGANAVRTAYSVEGDSTKAPVLTVTYDADVTLPVGGGCQRSTIVSLVSAGNNDAEEHADGSIDTGSSDLEMVQEADTQVVGLRFTEIPIANSAVITSAKLVFTADEIDSGTTSLTFEGQLSDDANAFSTSINDITNTTNRPRTSASAPWSPAAFASIGQLHEVTGLEGIIQEIVDRPGWVPENALALFISGTGTRVADSYDGDPATAPRLQITFEGTPITTQATVRSRLKDIVSSLVQASGTPISGAMLESAYYFRGEPVVFGRQRGTQSSNYRVSRVSHEASYIANGSTVTYPGACSEDNINHDDCRTQVISGGTPRYKSPIIAECQTNFLVQLTDGGGYYTGNGLSNTLAQSIDEQELINSLQARDDLGNLVSLSNCASDTTLSDGSSFSSSSAHNECTVKLAKFLHDSDQIYSSTQALQSGTSPIDGVQTIDTYNIGFNLCGNGNVTGLSSTGEQVCCAAGTLVADAEGIVQECPSPLTDPTAIQVLKAQSDVGGGKYFNANTVDELVVAFNAITSDIIEKGATFVAPSIAVNTFNRLFSRDEVYFGLFETAKSARWDGNVKKYRICVDPDPDGDGTDDCSLGDVLDDSGDPAVVDDPLSPDDDGQFELTAQSVWGGVEDGRETKLGGAGGEITDYRDRLIYTEFETGSGTAAAGTALSGAGYFFDDTNWDDTSVSAVRDEVCPDPTVLTAGSDCENRMLWLLGADTQDEDPLSDTRWWFHDVLHSSPVAVTYGQDASANFIDKVLVGTNDGALHFINGNSGVEEWAFMPRAVLADQQGLYDNSGVDHIYGLDSTPVVGVSDVNLDGVIDPATDFIGVVIAQRRGGDNIYALDLTPTATLTTVSSLIVPKFLWHINSSTAGFSRLGQSWSEPALVTINTTSGPISAVIFGGGYDTDLDLDDGSGLAKNFGLEAGNPNTGNAIYVVNATTGALIFSISGIGSGADIEIANMQYAIPSNVTVIDADGDGIEDRMYVGDTAGQVFRVDLVNVNPASATAPEGDTIVGVLANISTAGTLTDERRFFYRPTVVQVVDTEFSNAAGGEYDYVLIGSGNRANPLDRAVSDRFYAFRDVTTGVMTDSDSNNIADNYPINTDTSALGAPIDNSVLIDISATVLDASDTSTDSALGWFFDFGNTPAARDGEKVLAASNVLEGTAIFTSYVPDSGAAVADPCQAAEGNGVVYNLDILSTRATRDWDGDDTVEDLADRSYELGRPGIPSEVVSVFTKEGVTLLSGTEDLPGFDLPRFNTYWYEEEQ